MKLTKVEVFDFKSIKHEKLEINTNQLCLVGKNECGKSSIIQAISYLDFLETDLQTNFINKSSVNYPNGFPIISGVFQLTKNSFEKLSPMFDTKLLGGSKDAEKIYLQVKRWGNGLSNISLTLSDREKFSFDFLKVTQQKSQFINTFCKEIYPNIEYYENEELLIEAATVEDLLGNDRKFETFRRLLYVGGCKDLNLLNSSDDLFLSTFHATIEDRLNVILKKHYKQDESIKVNLRTIRDNKLSLVIKDGSGQSFAIEERSPGFRYYFSFLINKLWSKVKNENKNTILLLDEPGGSLHPNGAKDLLKSFDEITESSQIIYTTHNPFLTVRNCIDSLVFVDKSSLEGTKIKRKTYLNKYQILRKELGILLNDSFLIGDINLVVEGATEKLAFHRLFQIEKYQELEWLNIYNADGVTNMSQSLNYLGKNNLNLSGLVFMDSDEEARKEKMKKGYTNTMTEKNWEFLEVNDVFKDNQDRTFEDLFPQNLYVDAFNSYCNSLKNLEVFDKDFENFELKEPIPMPLINQLSVHYKSFISDEKKNSASITKQDVMRNLLNTIDSMDEKDKNKALENCYKILDKIKSKVKGIENYVSN
ncbi:MAG: AAA family ATPase [Acidobacteriota bacterium]|nr:AAA family ATPase [Acidobacteriota bacterium]